MTVIQPVADQDLFQIAIVVSQFNEEITGRLYQGAMERLKEFGFKEDRIVTVFVPGAIEIPIIAKRLAKSGVFEAVVCLGAVIRGDTSHYDYVCNQVSDGCQRIALDHEVPVIFGVLTTDNEEQALARVGGEHGHKGREAIDAAMAMVSVMRQLDDYVMISDPQ